MVVGETGIKLKGTIHFAANYQSSKSGAAMGNQEWMRRGENFTHLSLLRTAGLVRKIDA